MADLDALDEIERALRRAGVTAHVHARDIDGDAEIGVDADEPVVLASVFKVAVLVAFVRQWAAGRFELTERVRMPAAGRTPGGTGLSAFRDEAELSLRDLALSMMCVSDNAATDIIMDLVGADQIATTLAELGLERTQVRYDCRTLLDGLNAEMGFGQDFDAGLVASGLDPADLAAKLKATKAVSGRDTNRSTARETTRLLGLIWRDEAATAEACAEARRILGMQVFRDRLASGFDDGIKVSGKTGTLPFIRNEAGVVEYPDGARYAVAVFLRTDRLAYRAPDEDRTIGAVARIAVNHLRAARR